MHVFMYSTVKAIRKATRRSTEIFSNNLQWECNRTKFLGHVTCEIYISKSV